MEHEEFEVPIWHLKQMWSQIVTSSKRSSILEFQIDDVELHGPGLSINCLGCRVTSYATRDAKEIAKLLAMMP